MTNVTPKAATRKKVAAAPTDEKDDLTPDIYGSWERAIEAVNEHPYSVVRIDLIVNDGKGYPDRANYTYMWFDTEEAAAEYLDEDLTPWAKNRAEKGWGCTLAVLLETGEPPVPERVTVFGVASRAMRNAIEKVVVEEPILLLFDVPEDEAIQRIAKSAEARKVAAATAAAPTVAKKRGRKKVGQEDPQPPKVVSSKKPVAKKRSAKVEAEIKANVIDVKPVIRKAERKKVVVKKTA